MPDGEWAELLSKLIDVSPYLVVLVVMAVLFFFMYKAAIKSYEKISKTAMEKNTEMLTQSIARIQEAYALKK